MRLLVESWFVELVRAGALKTCVEIRLSPLSCRHHFPARRTDHLDSVPGRVFLLCAFQVVTPSASANRRSTTRRYSPSVMRSSGFS